MHIVKMVRANTPRAKASDFKNKRKKGRDGCMYVSRRRDKSYRWSKVNSKCAKGRKRGAKKSTKDEKRPTSKKSIYTMKRSTHPALKKNFVYPNNWKTLLRRPVDVSFVGAQTDRRLYRHVYDELMIYDFVRSVRTVLATIKKVRSEAIRKRIVEKTSDRWWNNLYNDISDYVIFT